MDKLSITSVNRNALRFINEGLPVKRQESIFLPKRLFLRFSSELTLFLLNFHRKRWERYEHVLENSKQRFRNTISHGEGPSRKEISISEPIIEAVLFKLDTFEQQKGFLNTDLNLVSLARELETNSSYLSKIINHAKGKTFKQYLNDLRVGYAHIELKNNPKLRRYTIAALAYDFGFKSAENFSKKFKDMYGIYPTKHLRELGKT